MSVSIGCMRLFDVPWSNFIRECRYEVLLMIASIT
jgi:hypothetical protein